MAVAVLAQHERRLQVVVHPARLADGVALELAVVAEPVALGRVLKLRLVALEVVALVAKVAEEQQAVVGADLRVAHLAERVVIVLVGRRAEAHLARQRHLLRLRRERIGEDRHVRAARRDLHDAGGRRARRSASAGARP